MSFALDQPESFLRAGNHENDERTLQVLGGAQCARKLSVCEAVTGDIAIPAQKLINLLEALDGDSSDTLVDDFKVLVNFSSTTAFAPLVAKVHSNSNIQGVLKTLRSVAGEIKSFEQQDPIGVFAVLIDAVTQLDGALSQITQLPDNTLQFIIFLLTFTAGLLGIIAEGPIAVAVYLLQSIISFITTFLGGLFTVALFPNIADPECQSDLMLCEYTKMMVEVLPTMFGTIFIAETPASA